MIAWLASAALGGAASFPADQFGRSDKTAAPSTGAPPLPQGTDRMEAVFARAPDDVFRQLGRSVGMLDLLVRTEGNLLRNDTCTATLIARDRILTNYHCVPGDSGTVIQAWLFLGFVEPPGLPGERFAVDVAAPIEKNAALDYAILAVKGVPYRYPALPVRVGQPKPRQTLSIIHHPLGQEQRLTSLGCRAARPALNPAGDFVHHCDTLGGSSGAVVLDQTQAVVALHKRGPMDEGRTYNLATPMSQIVAASAELQRITRQPVATAVVDVPDFVRIEPGTFTMGSPASEDGRGADEAPHRVTLTGAYWLATAEVTQGEYEALMGSNPARGVRGCFEYDVVSLVGADYPVLCVSWLEAVAYANKRSEREGLTPAYSVTGDSVTWDRSANGYRLPTEAEWEYAARAGTTTPWGGSTSREADVCALGNVGDAKASSKVGTYYWRMTCSDGAAGLAAVRSYRANPWGLYDMVGGVLEWTWDLYAPYGGDATDPVSATGSSRVVRGGCWRCHPSWARVAYRGRISPGVRLHELGFRLARSIP